MSNIRNKMIVSAVVYSTVAVMGTTLVAKPISYALPEEKSALKQTPGVDVVENNCASCHSIDYIVTQPQGAAFKKDFWTAEVTKMIKVYGAPIDTADVSKIIEFLATTH